MVELKKELKSIEEKEERMDELKKRRKSAKVAIVNKSEQEFDELFKEMDDVRKAVKRELGEADGGGYDEQVCIIASAFLVIF
jgi:hypothetical protein